MTLEHPVVTRIITWLPIGGIERRLVSVLPRLRDRGFRMRLICIRELGPLAEEVRAAGIELKLIPFRTRLDPVALRKLTRDLKSSGTEIVHAHMYRASVPGTIAAHFAKTPVMFSQVHNVDTWESSRQRTMDRWLARWRTGMICVSRAVQDDVCATIGLPREKAPILYNGSDTDIFKPDAKSREEGRREFGLDDSTVMALVPARMHAQKNPLGVLKAFCNARAKTNAKAVMFFAGGGPMEDELRAAIDAENAGEYVKLLGKRSDMPSLYNAADVMVLSSFKEGFSNAVVESLACGKPVIAADVGGNREAIHDPSVGWIHEAGDGETLTRQLTEAIADPEQLRARADACRARGLVFSLDQLIVETDKLYRSALAHARNTTP